VKVWYICRDDKFTIKSCSTLIDRLMTFNRTCSFKSSIWNKAAPPQNETFILPTSEQTMYKIIYFQSTSIIGTMLLCFLCSWIRIIRSYVASDQLCMEKMEKISFMVGVLWCVPKWVDELLFQWPAMVNGRFQRIAWRLLSYGMVLLGVSG
jgi:hypothetical protein